MFKTVAVKTQTLLGLFQFHCDSFEFDSYAASGQEDLHPSLTGGNHRAEPDWWGTILLMGWGRRQR